MDMSWTEDKPQVRAKILALFEEYKEAFVFECFADVVRDISRDDDASETESYSASRKRKILEEASIKIQKIANRLL